ncbi:hypothetical protein [Roseixanthobacter glucoisosaccharinicivorans]|uniref:hypothetical protein n=1 Tax=Roseixanthobacter glucoisosaccharinicivorans TaxID=3119923 RepID=UPI003727FF76
MRRAQSRFAVVLAFGLVLAGGIAPVAAQTTNAPLDVRPAPQATVPGAPYDATGSVRAPAPETGVIVPRGAPQGISTVPPEPNPSVNPGRNALGCPDMDPLCQNGR